MFLIQPSTLILTKCLLLYIFALHICGTFFHANEHIWGIVGVQHCILPQNTPMPEELGIEPLLALLKRRPGNSVSHCCTHVKKELLQNQPVAFL